MFTSKRHQNRSSAYCTVKSLNKEEEIIKVNEIVIKLNELIDKWERPLERIFPTKTKLIDSTPQKIVYNVRNYKRPVIKVSRPKVFIPVFPGTNCEYDTAKALSLWGISFQEAFPTYQSAH